MKCFLHIGTEKTATKTLQQFLCSNRDKLSRLGFAYTESAGSPNNLYLSLLAYNLSRRDDLTRRNRIYTDQDFAVFQENLKARLKNELEEKSRNNENKVIFSSEHMQSRLGDIEQLQRFKKILNDFGLRDISVIVYLRNPVEIASSLFSTRVKSGSLEEYPSLPTTHHYATVCNHQKTLERFGSVFGESALVPRIFHKSELKNGSIIDDFMEVVGIPDADDYLIPDNLNESLSATGIEILRRLNKLIPTAIEHRQNPLRSNLIAYIENHLSSPKYIMPYDLFNQYESYFHNSNEWVRKNFFPHRESLFDKEPYPTETKTKIPSEELDTIANVIGSIWNNKQQEVICALWALDKNADPQDKTVLLNSFDEESYLKANRDVAQAVRNGSLPSGWEHFVAYGFRENRPGVRHRAATGIADIPLSND